MCVSFFFSAVKVWVEDIWVGVIFGKSCSFLKVKFIYLKIEMMIVVSLESCED